VQTSNDARHQRAGQVVRLWFHNLRANPSVTVELGDRSFQAQAVVTEGEERDRLYGMISDGASEYEKNTDRVFPGLRPWTLAQYRPAPAILWETPARP
jgi:hypothetical protein